MTKATVLPEVETWITMVGHSHARYLQQSKFDPTDNIPKAIQYIIAINFRKG